MKRRDASRCISKANRSVSVEIGKLGLNVHFERNKLSIPEICEKFSRESGERMVLQAGLEIKEMVHRFERLVLPRRTCQHYKELQVISSIRMIS